MNITVKNINGVESLLEHYPQAAGEALKFTVKIAARDIVSYARKNHNYKDRTAKLSRSITNTYNDSNKTATVFLDLRQAAYGAYVHEGTRPHSISPRFKKCLRWASNGAFVFAHTVKHPGTNADRFLYKAADVVRPRIGQILAQQLEHARR